MATLKKLIKNQSLTFDTHQAGDGQPVHSDDLHMEKQLHAKPYGKIRFPLFGDREPTWSENVTDAQYSRVTREVKKELNNNPELARGLARTIIDQMWRYKSGSVTAEQAQDVARKIAGYFDLGADFIAIAVNRADSRLAQFSTLHPGDQPGTVIEIVQSAEYVKIRKPIDSWSKWKNFAQ